MCLPTNELKLCTCEFGGDLPDNYWILHRFNSSKKDFVLGELMYNYNNPITEATIGAFILASLNNSMCFDKELAIKNRDVLEINVVFDNENYHYYYKFSKGKWLEAKKVNPFELTNKYDEVSEGIAKPEISFLLKRILNLPA